MFRSGMALLVIIGWSGSASGQAGPIVVWGTTYPDLLNVPSGNFIAATGGGVWGAAIRDNGTIVVWGDPFSPTLFGIPQGTFRAVEGGTQYCVAIGTDGTLVGWGDPSFGLTSPPAGTFVKVSASEHHALALKTDGTVVQWGAMSPGPPTGQFIDVAAGKENFCLAVRADGTLVGWGNNLSGQVSVPGGVYVAVVAGDQWGAALRPNGSVVKWGIGGGNIALLTGSLTKIVSTYGHIYGMRPDGTIVGSSQFQTPPVGLFEAIGVGNQFGIAIPLQCYPNCDASSGGPSLTANDFLCFINRFASNDPYANCDQTGGLTPNDFACFLNRYAVGCS